MAVKKTLTIAVTDEELIELHRIILDQDEAAALAFVQQHLKKAVLRALEGG